MSNKKTAIMIDSEFGYTEKDAREKGFNFVPVIIYWDEKEGYSGIDFTLEYVYKNLDKDVKFRTATTPIGMIQEEYRKALKDADEVLFIPISKHLSSQMSSARLAAEDDEFKGKVHVYESEFIGPWIYYHRDTLVKYMNDGKTAKEISDRLDILKGTMFGYLFPTSMKRLYASGRISKAAYIAGSLLKIIPVVPIADGKLLDKGVIKKRSATKAIKVVFDQCIDRYKEVEAKGYKPKILSCTLGGDENADILVEMEKYFEDNGYKIEGRTYLPTAIVGHVGTGGIGVGITIDLPED